MTNYNLDIENQNVQYYQNNNVTFLQKVNKFCQDYPIVTDVALTIVGGVVTYALEHNGEIIEFFTSEN